MNTKETGMIGEIMVADFLRSKGYTIIKRNFHSRYGEIDIIASKDEYIVFTEVRTRKEKSLVSPAESVTAAKQKKVSLTALEFLLRFETPLQPRFDVAEVTVFQKADGTDGFKLNYIKNAF